jgi:hypothetical protein
MKTFFTFCFFALLSLSIGAQVYHVVPPDYTNTPGNGSFLSQFATSARTYQLLMIKLAPILNKQVYAVSWRLPTSATANSAGCRCNIY